MVVRSGFATLLPMTSQAPPAPQVLPNGLVTGLAFERALQARLFASADAGEGVAAFVEKRDASFEGR